MGGKSYYCDYCECYMKNNINVRKKHNQGLSHTIAKTTYMRRFESPSKILAEERAKVPCSRYWNGYCKFQLFCQYSHYSQKQLQKLKEIVKRLKKTKKSKHKPSQHLTRLQPMMKLPTKNLPPSLRPIDLRKLYKCNESNTWG